MSAQENNKKTVTATIKIDWLLYDIQNETYLRGRTIQNDENHKQVASMFASEDEENREKLLRSIKKGFSEVKTELSEYLNENGLTSDNSHIDGNSIHDYLKNTAISEWYMVTNKEDADQYVALANKSMNNIRNAVSKRSRPTRPE